MATGASKWQNTGVLFASPTGLSSETTKSSMEEFLIVAPLPGTATDIPYDGKANPMIVYRLFLDADGPLH